MSERCEIFVCDTCGKDWWIPSGHPGCVCGGKFVPAFDIWPPPERGDRCVWTYYWTGLWPGPLASRCACGWWRHVTPRDATAVALDHASRCAVVAHRIARAKVRT